MPLTLRSFARSEVGLVREGNEDSAYAGAHLVAVADGMGGHAAGEVASSITIDTLAEVDVPATAGSLDDAQTALPHAVREANERIRAVVDEHPRLDGMGTTATAAVWTGSVLVVAHVGDSRAYLLHGGKFEQITHDHTYVQALARRGPHHRGRSRQSPRALLHPAGARHRQQRRDRRVHRRDPCR